jgi:hypothetical protein
MNKIIINGVETPVTGKNIVCRILVDDVLISEHGGNIKISFEGDLANIKATNLTVNGNANGEIDATSVKVSGGINSPIINCTNLDVSGNITTTNIDATSVEANEIRADKIKATTIRGKSVYC